MNSLNSLLLNTVIIIIIKMFQKKNQIDLFYSEQAKIMRTLIEEYELKPKIQLDKQNIEINILVIGNKKSGKSSLINTFNIAFNNLKDLNKKTNINDIALIKTQLRKNKKFIVQSHKIKDFQNRSAINLFQYNQRIAMKNLSRFSKFFSGIDENIMVMCGQKFVKQSSKVVIRSLIFCIKLEEMGSEQEMACLNLLLTDAKQKKFKPIIALTYSDHIDRSKGENDYIENLEKQIMKISNQFDIARQQIFPIECYHDGSTFSEQINYYSLSMLHEVLKQAKQYSKFKDLTVKRSSLLLFCGC